MVLSTICSSLDLLTLFLSCLFVSLLAAFIARTRLNTANKRNKRILQEMAESNEKIDEKVEIGDTDPRYVFLT
jgi:hypothetical protein